MNIKVIFIFRAIIIFLTVQTFHFPIAFCQENVFDKIYPKDNDWFINCKILRLTERTIIVQFHGKEKADEIRRTSVRKIEYADGRQLIFNDFGQIEGETVYHKPVKITEILNLGILKIEDGREIVLNGVDYTLPVDSLEQKFFYLGKEFVKNLVLNNEIQLQFDVFRTDEFGRMLVYAVLPGGTLLNAELIRRGYCRVDKKRPLLYLEDFILLEGSAKLEKSGIWSIIKINH
ncbi:thermonuclease family protein [candidate division KSB1 bacterium]